MLKAAGLDVVASAQAQAQASEWKHALSLFGDIKYPAGFKHFDYVNPDAPKGGTARQIGLVDRYGGMSEALAEAAKRAKLKPDGWHAVYIEPQPSFAGTLLGGLPLSQVAPVCVQPVGTVSAML